MNRPFRPRVCFPALAAASLLAWSGCDYSPEPSVLDQPAGRFQAGAEPVAPSAPAGEPGAGATTAAAGGAPASAGEERSEEKAAILDNVVKLIQSAATNPGGDHFGNATKNLNQFFSGTPRAEYALDLKAREFLAREFSGRQLGPDQVQRLEARDFEMPDARHLEDCMLYHGIAMRVAGHGDDLTRVRRVFDWMVRQVQLVPAGRLGAPGLGQAFARPYDVLLRGMATESQGFWSERGWLFISLCRQLGLDAGMLTYTPRGAEKPVVWCVAVLVDGKPYLFDQRIGLAVPDAKGDGVATLEEAVSSPVVLERLELPGQEPYGTTRASLVGSTSKVGVLIDSGLRYFSPRMRILQKSLAGKNTTVLFRDPAEQRGAWAKALGKRLGRVGLWELPMTVESLLFTNPQFVRSTQESLTLFRQEFPLLYARMKQLRGETSEAVQDYVALRLRENAPLVTDKNKTIPKDIQTGLDAYATYYLGTCHLERDDPDKAKFFFEQTLTRLPDPGRNQYFYYMFRWGAQANLARLFAAEGEIPKAVAYYSQKDETSQYHGNLLKARDLVFLDPLTPPADLPPAPESEPKGPGASVTRR